MNNPPIANQIEMHSAYIRSIDEYEGGSYFLPDSTIAPLHDYAHRTAALLRDSLDAVFIDKKTQIEFWNKNQEWCCGYFGTPQMVVQADNYLIKPEWTDPKGGRFGTAVGAHPVLRGKTLDNQHQLELRLVQGKYTGANSDGITLESEEGTVVRIRPLDKESKVTIVNCIRRTEAPAAYDNWFTEQVQHGTNIFFDKQNYVKKDERERGAKYQYVATLPNGWMITQHTDYLATFGRGAGIHKQVISIERKDPSPSFPVAITEQLLEERPTVKNWFFDMYSVVADGLPLQGKIVPLTQREEVDLGVAYKIASIPGMVCGLSPEAHQLDIRKKLYENWRSIKKLQVVINEHETTIAPMNHLLKKMAEYSSANR